MRRIKRHPVHILPALDSEPVRETLNLDLGQARTELRFLRANNARLHEIKAQAGHLRARMADLVYGLSEKT